MGSYLHKQNMYRVRGVESSTIQLDQTPDYQISLTSPHSTQLGPNGFPPLLSLVTLECTWGNTTTTTQSSGNKSRAV